MIFSKGLDMIRATLGRRDGKAQLPIETERQSSTGNDAMKNEIEQRTSDNRQRIKIDLLVHDLKVPLAVIEAGISSLLTRPEKYGPVTEKQQKVLARVLRNTKVTQALVNDTLELGRSREGLMNYISLPLSELLEQAIGQIFDLVDSDMADSIKTCASLDVLRRALQEKGLYLQLDEALWCREVCIDGSKATQILRNLLTNALKYRKTRVELSVDLEKDGEAILFAVKDDGEGIPAVFHKKIFDCYFQMDATDVCSVRGHGLGLAGVMVLIEDMGGSLWLESDEGKGATFRVRLPLKVDQKGASAPTPPAT